MTDAKNRTKDNGVRLNRPDRGDINEITNRLQAQVNDLVERVTGMRQVKRQYLMIGLTIGMTIGMTLGVLVGILMHAVTDHSEG